MKILCATAKTWSERDRERLNKGWGPFIDFSKRQDNGNVFARTFQWYCGLKSKVGSEDMEKLLHTFSNSFYSERRQRDRVEAKSWWRVLEIILMV